jgi:hypothetical protein
MHIRRRMGLAKSRMNSSRTKLEDSLRMSRELLAAGTLTSQTPFDKTVSEFNPLWLSMGKKTKTRTVTMEDASQPKYVGQQANELSKYMNSESITRHNEECNLNVPTLRQVLKVDDGVSVKQMTKSQLAAVPFDPTVDREKRQQLPAHAKKRHLSSYRPNLK